MEIYIKIFPGIVPKNCPLTKEQFLERVGLYGPRTMIALNPEGPFKPLEEYPELYAEFRPLKEKKDRSSRIVFMILFPFVLILTAIILQWLGVFSSVDQAADKLKDWVEEEQARREAGK